MAIPSWPTYTDDSGLGLDGTEFDEIFFDACEAALEALILSSTNPTVYPNAITDEVVTARGNLASLNARIGNVVDVNGNILTAAGQASVANLQSVLGVKNLVINDDLRLWHRGDSSAPTGYVESGTGTIARTGTGLADTERKVGLYSAKMNRTSGTYKIYHKLLATGDYNDYFDLKKIGFGAYVKTSLTSSVRIYITDGVTTTYSKYHTGTVGGSAWEFLNETAGGDTLVHTVSSSATKLEIGIESTSTGDVYFDGFVAIFGDYAPPKWIPCDVLVDKTWVVKRVDTPLTGDDQEFFCPQRPTLLFAIQSLAGTAPSGGTFDVDIRATTGPGVAGNSVFSGGAVSLNNDGKKLGGVAVDGTYQYRCLPGTFLDDASASSENAIWTFDIDALNGIADVTIFCRTLQYTSPLEHFRAHNSWGE